MVPCRENFRSGARHDSVSTFSIHRNLPVVLLVSPGPESSEEASEIDELPDEMLLRHHGLQFGWRWKTTLHGISGVFYSCPAPQVQAVGRR
jgi:hypothetical protein